MTNNVGTLLWEMRTTGGWTLGRLAQQAGVSKMALSRWEAGTRQPRIPELEAVLNALNATAAQRADILSGIQAPRAVQRLKNLSASSGLNGIPNAGDLLQTMRLRKGMTQTDVASQLNVTQATVARWEQSSRLPDAAQIQALCYVLGAYEAEIVALTIGQFSDPTEEQAQNWHEEEEAIRTALFAEIHSGRDIPADLFYLTLERKAMRWAIHEEKARPVLGLLYGWHAQFLRNIGRTREIAAVAQKALQYADPKDFDVWGRAIVLSAMGAVYTGDKPTPERGIRQLRYGLNADISPAFRAWILSDIAAYSEMMGQGEQSLSMLMQACRVAELSKNEVELFLRRCDLAEAFLKADRPCDALKVLPSLGEGYHQENVKALLLWSEAHRQAGNPSEAHDALMNARNLIDQNQFEWWVPRAESQMKRF